jgi:hypothetical protein
MNRSVLEVLETAGCRIRNSEPLVTGEAQRLLCRSIADEVRDARGAVMELMEAASWYAYGGVRPAKEWAEANKRLRAALEAME